MKKGAGWCRGRESSRSNGPRFVLIGRLGLTWRERREASFSWQLGVLEMLTRGFCSLSFGHPALLRFSSNHCSRKFLLNSLPFLLSCPSISSIHALLAAAAKNFPCPPRRDLISFWAKSRHFWRAEMDNQP